MWWCDSADELNPSNRAIGDMQVSGIVLAGGASRRMGRDKAWLELGGKFFIERVIDALRHTCSEILIVTNVAFMKNAQGFEKLDARIVRDEFPNTGSLGGLYSGLHAAQNELAVAVACDMPFLNHSLVQFLISLSTDYDIVIPSGYDTKRRSDERKPQRVAQANTAKKLNLHPLHAVYRKTCLEPMRSAILQNDLRMISFHDAVRVKIVEQTEIEKFDPQHFSLWNVNTPEELERASVFVAEGFAA